MHVPVERRRKGRDGEAERKVTSYGADDADELPSGDAEVKMRRLLRLFSHVSVRMDTANGRRLNAGVWKMKVCLTVVRLCRVQRTGRRRDRRTAR